jgi:hypothetical protein
LDKVGQAVLCEHQVQRSGGGVEYITIQQQKAWAKGWSETDSQMVSMDKDN